MVIGRVALGCSAWGIFASGMVLACIIHGGKACGELSAKIFANFLIQTEGNILSSSGNQAHIPRAVLDFKLFDGKLPGFQVF